MFSVFLVSLMKSVPDRTLYRVTCVVVDWCICEKNIYKVGWLTQSSETGNNHKGSVSGTSLCIKYQKLKYRQEIVSY